MLLWSLTRSWNSTYEWGSQPQQQRVLRSGTYKRVRPIPQIKLSWDGKDQYLLKPPASFVARISILGCLNHVQSPCLMVTWLKESTWINRTILEDWTSWGRRTSQPMPCPSASSGHEPSTLKVSLMCQASTKQGNHMSHLEWVYLNQHMEVSSNWGTPNDPQIDHFVVLKPMGFGDSLSLKKTTYWYILLCLGLGISCAQTAQIWAFLILCIPILGSSRGSASYWHVSNL